MSMAGHGFTAEEKALLAPYVTTTEGDVFALTNLPEVVKGALFSRYSRSALGLRELLLKEFIQGADAELAAMQGGPPDAGGAEASRVAVWRAQDFYDRILDGYGDDSIGELGGAHLALENVSMLAAKALQDARIGGSPLEKSTRYVSFADQRNGDYLFYKEPTLMASPHRERYLEANRGLFAAYAELIAPLIAHIERAAPRPEEVAAGAYRRAVRARALDALRGLLPASALTNMGIFGNGRFFETLAGRLRTSPLAECQALGDAMTTELGKTIPSFVRRAETGHPHFVAFRDFAEGQRAALQKLAAECSTNGAPATDAAEEAGGVRLVEHDPAAEEKVLAALAFPDSALPLPALREWARGVGDAEREGIFRKLGDLRTNRRHKPPRALELPFYTFELVGDYGMYRDLHRHRMLTQDRQRLSTRWGYAMSPEVAEAGLAPQFEAALAHAADAYEAIAADYPEEAQYVVPMAYRIRWYVHINLRALLWLVELRSAPQGHPAYRAMARQMYLRVQAVHPRLAGLFRFVNMEDMPLGRLGAELRQEARGGG